MVNILTFVLVQLMPPKFTISSGAHDGSDGSGDSIDDIKLDDVSVEDNTEKGFNKLHKSTADGNLLVLKEPPSDTPQMPPHTPPPQPSSSNHSRNVSSMGGFATTGSNGVAATTLSKFNKIGLRSASLLSLVALLVAMFIRGKDASKVIHYSSMTFTSGVNFTLTEMPTDIIFTTIDLGPALAWVYMTYAIYFAVISSSARYDRGMRDRINPFRYIVETVTYPVLYMAVLIWIVGVQEVWLLSLFVFYTIIYGCTAMFGEIYNSNKEYRLERIRMNPNNDDDTESAVFDDRTRYKKGRPRGGMHCLIGSFIIITLILLCHLYILTSFKVDEAVTRTFTMAIFDILFIFRYAAEDGGHKGSFYVVDQLRGYIMLLTSFAVLIVVMTTADVTV